MHVNQSLSLNNSKTDFLFKAFATKNTSTFTSTNITGGHSPPDDRPRCTGVRPELHGVFLQKVTSPQTLPVVSDQKKLGTTVPKNTITLKRFDAFNVFHCLP